MRRMETLRQMYFYQHRLDRMKDGIVKMLYICEICGVFILLKLFGIASKVFKSLLQIKQIIYVVIIQNEQQYFKFNSHKSP